MKISVTLTIIISVLMIILIVSCTMLSSTPSFQPYLPERTNIMFDYSKEGFRNNEYSTYPDNKPTSDSIASCKSVTGFDGLLCSPDGSEKPNDIFSDTEGSLECKSYGYSNSRGNLCLNPEQVRLLTTRGGNA